MDKRIEAKLAMIRLILFVLGKYGALYATANGLLNAVDALQELFDALTGQNQLAEDSKNSGGATARKQATEELGDLAYSVSASVLSYASTIGDRSLVDRMSYSRWEITRGRASSIIARCQGISTTASGLAAELVDYLVTPAELKLLEKRIGGFEEAFIKPRQGTVIGVAARQEMPDSLNRAIAVIEERIDGMLFRFKTKSPEFYNEYMAARVVVNLPTSSSDKAEKPSNVVPNPGTASAPVPATDASTKDAAGATGEKTAKPSGDAKVA